MPPPPHTPPRLPLRGRRRPSKEGLQGRKVALSAILEGARRLPTPPITLKRAFRKTAASNGTARPPPPNPPSFLSPEPWKQLQSRWRRAFRNPCLPSLPEPPSLTLPPFLTTFVLRPQPSTTFNHAEGVLSGIRRGVQPLAHLRQRVGSPLQGHPFFKVSCTVT